jgi:hypothetical protein
MEMMCRRKFKVGITNSSCQETHTEMIAPLRPSPLEQRWLKLWSGPKKANPDSLAPEFVDEADLSDPNIGALTQIVEQYKPEMTPVIVTDLVRDIDTIVRQVAYTAWAECQPGDKAAGREIRLVLQKYWLPVTGPLFDQTYAYIRENY